MARYIDVDKLNLDAEVEMADDWKTAHEIANIIKYAPAEDVTPVVHAKWVKGRYCSNCECDDYDYCCRQPKYCPECGAKMEKE